METLSPSPLLCYPVKQAALTVQTLDVMRDGHSPGLTPQPLSGPVDPDVHGLDEVVGLVEVEVLVQQSSVTCVHFRHLGSSETTNTPFYDAAAQANF